MVFGAIAEAGVDRVSQPAIGLYARRIALAGKDKGDAAVFGVSNEERARRLLIWSRRRSTAHAAERFAASARERW